MSEYRVCPRCMGDGWADEYRGVECSNCAGDGEIEIIDFEPYRMAKAKVKNGPLPIPMQDWEHNMLQENSGQ